MNIWPVLIAIAPLTTVPIKSTDSQLPFLKKLSHNYSSLKWRLRDKSQSVKKMNLIPMKFNTSLKIWVIEDQQTRQLQDGREPGSSTKYRQADGQESERASSISNAQHQPSTYPSQVPREAGTNTLENKYI